MTYTVVYKDYHAATLEEAAAAMLRDGEVWRRGADVFSGFSREPEVDGGYHGDYAVVEWSWDGSRLRVWFR